MEWMKAPHRPSHALAGGDQVQRPSDPAWGPFPRNQHRWSLRGWPPVAALVGDAQDSGATHYRPTPTRGSDAALECQAPFKNLALAHISCSPGRQHPISTVGGWSVHDDPR
jgi:hypothetical protein